MTGLGDILLLRPFWFVALPLILALMVWRLRRAGRAGDWGAVIEPHLMAAMVRMGRVAPGGRPTALAAPFLIAAGVALALVGPGFSRPTAQTFRNLDGVVFVIDVSGSVTRDASWPALVNMARAGLSVLADRPAALIVYAGDSYLAAPLTTDHLQLGQTISLLDADTVPDRGNRPALALHRAADLLDEADILGGEVVLFTDGQGLGPDVIQAASRIAALGGQLSVVQSETTISGAVLPGREALQSLAQIGRGAVYGAGDLAAFMTALSPQGAARLELQDLRLLLVVDYGRYLLLLALLPALLLFRREVAR